VSKGLANKADKRRWQDALAAEQRRRELAKRAAAMAERALAMEQCRQESDKLAVATAKKALAAEQCCRELAKHTAEMAVKALATEQRHQESAKCAAEMAEKGLATEHCCQELAKCTATLADSVLAKEQRLSLLAAMALAEYDAQTIVSWDAAMVEAIKHAMTLVVMALTKLKAAPKLRYGGPPLTYFSPPLTAKEVAKLDAAILDKQRRHETAAREKSLADEAKE
jgi:hypothetical protein